MDGAHIDTNEASDLFPPALDCIPHAFAGETLYSWCARYHRLIGETNPRATSRRLFGHPTAGLRPELPFHLGNFQENTQQRLGNLNDLLRQRTVFGFYAPFLPPKAIAEIVGHLAVGNCVAARARLGMSKDGQASRAPLRFCPECSKEQLATNTISWWQVEHLWPSICVCQRHGQPLLQIRDELLERSSADYYQAHELDATQLIAPQDITASQLQLLTGLANWTTVIMRQRDGAFDDTVLRFSYLLQAKRRGWISLDGSLRLKLLQDAFLSRCASLATSPAFEFVARASSENGGFLGALFRQHPGRRHPSKHIVLMEFLFEQPEAFLAAYAEAQAVIEKDGQQGAQKLLTNKIRTLIKLIESSKLSVSAAAQTLGIAAEEALSHLRRRTDVRRPRRPHVVGTEREKQLREMLSNGCGRREIVESLALHPSFIKSYMAQHPELRAQWETAHRAKERELHRIQLLSALDAHPGLPIRAIRRLPQNGFQWLYKHDLEWLREILPAIWKR